MADTEFEIFSTIDDTTIEKIVFDELDEILNEKLYDGDERKMFANAFVALLCTVFAYLNDCAKMRLLRFARGEILDELGKRVKCFRLPKEKATSVARYKLGGHLNINVLVPMGSTLTPDGVLVFETTKAATIPAGNLFVDVPIISQNGGSIYNDYAPGTINTQISNIPYIAEVTNIVVTKGGDDGEPYPLSDEHPDGDDGAGDNHYRERIRTAPAGFSTAGPEDAYKYFSLSSNANVKDVKVESEQAAGRIDITVITKDGQEPPELLKKVFETCSDKSSRPMNDDVHVHFAEKVLYDIEVKYYTTEDTEADAVRAIEFEGGAIEKYNEWQTSKIARDINPDKLKEFLMAAGAKRADIIKPVFKKLDTTDSVTAYSVKDSQNNIRYVSFSGVKDSNVDAGVDVFVTPGLTGEKEKSSEGQYFFTGDEVLSPKGIGEIAKFSGNLKLSHEIEGE